MGSKVSTFWRSESVQPTDDDLSSGHEDEPTCDPKTATNGHSNESGDEDTQQDQDGGNLDGKNDDSEDTHLDPVASNVKDNRDQECVHNGGQDDDEGLGSKDSKANYKNGSNGNGVDDESCNEGMDNGTTNGESSIPIIMLNDIYSHENSSQLAAGSKNEFSINPAEQAKMTYAAVTRNNNNSKVIMGAHQRQSQLTLESRKREHSADSDRSTPNYPHAYVNDLPIGGRSKKAKSSETDSVSSSRSDRASTEIEQITPKVAKSRKRRAKPAKKYLS